jgi:uncharacterized protein (DUF1778 family)
MAHARTNVNTESARKREKPERFEARITRQQKELLQRAADLEGRSLTDFVMSSAQAAARQTVRDHQLLRLSSRDQEAFARALAHPPSPAPRLRAAYEHHRDELG